MRIFAACLCLTMSFAVTFAGDNDIKKELKQILEARTDAALHAVLHRVQYTMDEKSIKRLLVLLANNVDSQQKIPTEIKAAKKKYRRDLAIAGERCLYALEAILRCDIPVRDKEMSRTKVLEEVVLALTYQLDIVKRGDDEALALAKNKDTSPFMLERLAGHANWHVRLALFANPNVPDYIIRRLSDDDVPQIKEAVWKRVEEDLKKPLKP